MKLILRHFALDGAHDEDGEPVTVCEHIDVGGSLTIELIDSQGTSALAVAASESSRKILYNHNIDWNSEVDSYTD